MPEPAMARGFHQSHSLDPPVVPFYPLFFWEGSALKIDYRKKGTLILTSLLEDLVVLAWPFYTFVAWSQTPCAAERKFVGRTVGVDWMVPIQM